jgi:predicted transport protein
VPIDAGDLHYFLNRLLHGTTGAILIIDERTSEIEEGTEDLAQEIQILEFKTYARDGDYLHISTPLHPPKTTSGKQARLWNERLTWTPPLTKKTVEVLIHRVGPEILDVVHGPRYKWHSFYVSEPTKRKNEFATIQLGKKVVKLSIGIDPKSFDDPANLTHPVVGWFFPKGTERRINVTLDNLRYVLGLVKRSHQTMVKRLRH